MNKEEDLYSPEQLREKFIIRLNLIKSLFSSTEERYLELINNKYDKTKDSLNTEEESNLIYLDLMLLNQMDKAIKDKTSISYYDMLNLYLNWITRWSTVVMINSKRYKANTKIRQHVDAISKLVLSTTPRIIKTLEDFVNKAPN